MNKKLKKIISGVSITAIGSTMFLSGVIFGGAVNNTTGSVDANSFTISGADATTFDGATSATVSVEKDGVAVTNFDSVVVNQGTPDTIVIMKTGAFGNGYYVVTFNTDNGVFGSVTLDQNATYNKVVVTATVIPTLSFTLTNNNSNLGVLSPGVFSTSPVDLDLNYSTNAVGGIIIGMSSTGLHDSTVDHEIGVTNISSSATNDGIYVYEIDGNVISTSANVLATQNVVNTGSPVFNATTSIQLGAEITNVTPAGNYSDTLTFNVTGSF